MLRSIIVCSLAYPMGFNIISFFGRNCISTWRESSWPILRVSTKFADTGPSRWDDNYHGWLQRSRTVQCKCHHADMTNDTASSLIALCRGPTFQSTLEYGTEKRWRLLLRLRIAAAGSQQQTPPSNNPTLCSRVFGKPNVRLLSLEHGTSGR